MPRIKDEGPMPDFTGKTISDGRYLLEKLIGGGSFGVVYRAYDLQTPTSASDPSPVVRAIKILRKAKEDDLNRNLYQREAWHHRKVMYHINVLTIYHMFECETYKYLVLEYVNGGTLSQRIIKNDTNFGWGRDERLKSLYLQILDAVNWCHQRGIYHRDLKSDNILCNKDLSQIYLSDFGLSTSKPYSERFHCGSKNHMSPGEFKFLKDIFIMKQELMRNEHTECFGTQSNWKRYSTVRNDIWSLGVILFFMITGGHPWDTATTDDEYFCNFIKYGESFFHAYGISEGASAILQNIFFLDPKSRISLKRLRKKIENLDTFFMSEEEILQMNEKLQLYYYGCEGGHELAYDGHMKTGGDDPDDDAALFQIAHALEQEAHADSRQGARYDFESPIEYPEIEVPSQLPPSYPGTLRSPVVLAAESSHNVGGGSSSTLVNSKSGCGSLYTSSGSSGEDSVGVATPPTLAQIPEVDVPDLDAEEGLGDALELPVLVTAVEDKDPKTPADHDLNRLAAVSLAV